MLIDTFLHLGIEVKFKNQNYPILIAPTHIPELNAVEHTADGIIFGTSVTLSTLEDVLREATDSLPGNMHCVILRGESFTAYKSILGTFLTPYPEFK